MKKAIPDQVLAQHVAFLGKTGSGKTSTAKLAVEQILREDAAARVCVLDTVKSDWWGLTSSADGRRPGLPFHILGGPRGHVPLHESAGKAIGELVATGALPLSIIDMADFAPGGVQKFFNDFAPVLLRKMRGVVHLVIEEAHEVAPKERAGFAAENMAIHWAKKLATAGRSKGLRIMVLTQRTQALHNAVLGSCDTIIAHRLTAPADQGPVKQWLKANVAKDVFEQVSNSLASLKTGTGWICSGEAQVAELVQFPKITTFDNSATPTGAAAAREIKTAPVDAERLRAIIGDAVKDAEANDPAKLRAQIVTLTAANAGLEQKVRAGIVQAAADPAAIVAAERSGYERALREASADLAGRMAEFGAAFQVEVDRLEKETLTGLAKIRADTVGTFAHWTDNLNSGSPTVSASAADTPKRETAAVSSRAPSAPAALAGVSNVSPTVRKILDTIHRAYPVALSFESAALRAAVSRRSSAYNKYRAEIEASRELSKRDDGRFTSAPGYASEIGPGTDPIKEFASKLPPSYAKMLTFIAGAGSKVTKEQIAEGAGVSPTSSGLGAGISELIALGLVQKAGDRGSERYSIHEDLR